MSARGWTRRSLEEQALWPGPSSLGLPPLSWGGVSWGPGLAPPLAPGPWQVLLGWSPGALAWPLLWPTGPCGVQLWGATWLPPPCVTFWVVGLWLCCGGLLPCVPWPPPVVPTVVPTAPLLPWCLVGVPVVLVWLCSSLWPPPAVEDASLVPSLFSFFSRVTKCWCTLTCYFFRTVPSGNVTFGFVSFLGCVVAFRSDRD